MRRFERRPVEPELLDRLIALTAAAPSVGYSQPARFVRVDDPGRRKAIVLEYERANDEAAATYSPARARAYTRLKLAGLKEAPIHLAVFADESTQRGSGLGRRTMPDALAYSAVTAVHTLWLAARVNGLGLGWVSILEPRTVASILSVPEDWRFIAYLCVGYPVEEHLDRELVRADWETDDPDAALVLQR